MRTIFIAVLLMTLTGSGLYLLLLLLRPITRRLFGASWHYVSCIAVLLFLLLPVSAVGGPVFSAVLNSTGSDLPQIQTALTEMFSAPEDTAAPAQAAGSQAASAAQSANKFSVAGQNAGAPDAMTVVVASDGRTISAKGAAAANGTPAIGNMPAFSLAGLLPYLPFIWPVGALCFLALQLIRHARFKRRLFRTNLPVEDRAIRAQLDGCMSRMGIHKNIQLMSSSLVTTPMLTGIIKCVLILPEIDMSDAELTMVLRHELTHLKRRDILIKLLALVAGSVHWFNPFAYRLRRDIDTYCEHSCDEQVVSGLNAEERRFYGETILNVLCRVTKRREGLFAAFAATRSGFEKRLLRILHYKAVSKRTAAFAAAVLFLLGLIGCGAGGLAGAKLEPTKELTVCYDSAVSLSQSSAMKAFTAANPDVKIKYVILPDRSMGSAFKQENRDTMIAQLRTQVMAGEGPDLFILQSGTYKSTAFFQDIEKAMRGGVFCDLLPLFRQAELSMDDFIAPVMEAGQVGGKQYVVPLYYEVLGVVTNETTRKIVGDGAFKTAASMLDGLRAITQVPDAAPIFGSIWQNFRFLMNYDPFYLSSPRPVDYDAPSAHIDSPFFRDILEMTKFAYEKEDALIDRPGLSPDYWKTYVQSEQYFALWGDFYAMAADIGMSEHYGGYTPYLDAFPSEDGGVRAEVSLYAGIRANSANKYNAVEFLKTLLSPECQAKPADHPSGFWNPGWPVRKGALSEHLKFYVDKNVGGGYGYGEYRDGKFVGSYMAVAYTAPLSEEAVKSFEAIESKITTAAFSPPAEFTGILKDYIKSDLDLDTAILRMQDYYDKSLEE
jgi:beta-lactamase regulating signal transducer with metallopeptidase domain